MTDFHARFRSLDAVVVPDLWDEITRRAEQSISTESLRRVSVGRATPVMRARRGVSWTVILVGIALVLAGLGGGALIAGALNATPSPTVAPSPTLVHPSLPPLPSLGEGFGDQPFEVGSTDRFFLAWNENDLGGPIQKVVATVPSGWTLESAARGGGVANGSVRLNYGHASRFGCGPTAGPTVDDLVANLAVIPGITVTDLVIDGYPGKRVEFTEPTDNTTCGWPMGWHEQLSILDINGTSFVIDAEYAPGTAPSDQAQLQAIVDSIELH